MLIFIINLLNIILYALFPNLLNHRILSLNSIQRELYLIRQIWEMLINSRFHLPIFNQQTWHFEMFFKALRKAIRLLGTPSIPACTDISEIPALSISRSLNIRKLNLFSKWKHVEWKHIIQVLNEHLLYTSHCATKKRWHGFYPQGAGHFILSLCNGNTGHVAALCSSKRPQKLNVRFQRLTQAMYCTEWILQPRYWHQARVAIKTPPNTF